VKQLVLNRRFSKLALKRKILITYSNPESIISEQYRMIQANIKFSTEDKKSKTFLITSPNRGEGKSSTAANLAVSIAQQKEKVLLIDANLRSPEIHSIFKMPNSPGLTDVLTGMVRFEDAINHTVIGRLDVLTSGKVPVNPVELLASRMMQELLASLPNYDVVLIDSYSVLELTDTKLLANQCDGVVMVIQKGKTQLDQASEAKKVLEFAKAKLIGVIINE
jgi:capsular exopolysaccharide synthesis family protein